MENNLGKDELIILVEKIINVEGSENEINDMICILEKNVLHPEVTDLIFYNDEHLTPEEIVEKALSYQPITL
ncbi:bacteriocin immunity protein [Bacillus sp. FJAT-29814]|uniref:bacteriocin immunity protein n=1 Tax=Bacillus sp. FJAT-29814 TaxID=1729688 RepID=UPI00083753A6|nr:bacteriocin immunity protein [Bacillus sp. FJAT-29814]